MTSNERKIIKCLQESREGKRNIKFLSAACGLSSDYTRLLCQSLDRAGYLKFEDRNVCHLLKKGQKRFATASFANALEKPQEKKAQKQVLKAKWRPALLDVLEDASLEEKKKLVQAGYKSPRDLAETPIVKLIQGVGVSLKKAAQWINQSRREMGAICDEKTGNKK